MATPVLPPDGGRLMSAPSGPDAPSAMGMMGQLLSFLGQQPSHHAPAAVPLRASLPPVAFWLACRGRCGAAVE
jgi:hypothetical protein